MITSPKLEERYIVLKIRDLKAADALQATREFLRTNGIKTIDCVVVEADWPQYRTVVDMIIPDQSQQSAPAGYVVMPERRIQALAGVSLFDLGHAKGWNACLDKFESLNRSKT